MNGTTVLICVKEFDISINVYLFVFILIERVRGVEIEIGKVCNCCFYVGVQVKRFSCWCVSEACASLRFCSNETEYGKCIKLFERKLVEPM